MSTPEVICGLCGVGNRTLRTMGAQWPTYYRALYCVGPHGQEPKLSGLGFYGQEEDVKYNPPESHQRFDDQDLDPLSLVTIRGLGPPSLHETGNENYAWGFRFHDTCWCLAEQASAPYPVDLKILWRILRSVPHSHVPLWGHTYGGLYSIARRDKGRSSRHFMPLGTSTSLFIPSAYYNPFNVPELKARLAQLRADTGDSIPIKEEEAMTLMPPPTEAIDPFSILPPELREIILTYVDTADVLSLRLSSWVIATTPLSQGFFQSRFWPGRELDFLFDGFLLSRSDKAGIDWRELYRLSKERIKHNLVGLGERNRLRIWKQTVRPLIQATYQIAKLTELRGNSELEDPRGLWRSIQSWRDDIELVGDLNLCVNQAEIELPSSRIEAIHVSFINFFGTKFISGLAFETEHGEDIEIGYINPGSEEPLIVEGSLEGFHVAVDYYGLRAISPYTGKHMESEYLDWVGDTEDLRIDTLKCTGPMIQRIRATFDGFRLQSLHIPESQNDDRSNYAISKRASAEV
ncbi:hypothetical protein F5Y03DRAFT_80152 [Xylaria venustula]|nr:hypothetical protein F5Y03DRAFT_80152 [Xylaria venustula]